MTVGYVVRCSSIFLASVYLMATTHKVTILRLGRASRHPVIDVSPRLRRFPRVAIALALGAEVVATILLIAVPGIGFAVSSILLALYLFLMRHLEGARDCECFTPGMSTSVKAAITRNLLMLGVSISGVTFFLLARNPSIDPVGFATALPVCFLVVAIFASATARRQGGFQAS